MKKIVLVTIVSLMIFSGQTFAGCGGCGGDHSHDDTSHAHDQVTEKKSECSSCEKKSSCSSSKGKLEKISKQPSMLKSLTSVKNQEKVDDIMNDYHEELEKLNKKYEKKLKKYQ
ncbi:MAG: hypothetical protein CL503_00230 [Actinobacteria bacterium]|mgnify:FL=1|nr:hypothetical protein [Actinomycetota bacterium]|tara:strand:+ start:3060 stop:3401 length:342 start_codon:yes stop_codon:yes gene_type:complete